MEITVVIGIAFLVAIAALSSTGKEPKTRRYIGVVTDCKGLRAKSDSIVPVYTDCKATFQIGPKKFITLSVSSQVFGCLKKGDEGIVYCKGDQLLFFER